MQANIRQAIRTRYHGPTNIKGSRISAKCEAKTIFIEYDDALNIDENHIAAAAKLTMAMGWVGKNYGTTVAGVFDRDYYHVMVIA